MIPLLRHDVGQPVLAALALLLAVALALTSTSALTQFGDADPEGGNTFTTASCLVPRVKDVQRGTLTNTTNGTQTVTLATAVDSTQAFVHFDARHDSNRPVGSLVRARLASATTVEFIRVTNEAPVSAISVSWSVVEYECGVRVQRGEVSQTAATVNVTLPTAVGSTARAFVLASKTVGATETTWDANEAVVADLTSTTNLQLRTSTAVAADIVAWQVVEFTKVGSMLVQQGNAALTGNTLTVNVTLPTAVDPAKTFVLTTSHSTATSTQIGRRLFRATLTSTTNLQVHRLTGNGTNPITQIGYQVVSLLDGSVVQCVSAAFANGVATATAVLSPTVDLRRSTPLASASLGSGQSSGRSDYTVDDIVGVSAVTMVLTTGQLQLTRAATNGAADHWVCVVSWGRA